VVVGGIEQRWVGPASAGLADELHCQGGSAVGRVAKTIAASGGPTVILRLFVPV